MKLDQVLFPIHFQIFFVSLSIAFLPYVSLSYMIYSQRVLLEFLFGVRRIVAGGTCKAAVIGIRPLICVHLQRVSKIPIYATDYHHFCCNIHTAAIAHTVLVQRLTVTSLKYR